MLASCQSQDYPQFSGLTVTVPLSHATQKAYQSTVNKNDFILRKTLETLSFVCY